MLSDFGAYLAPVLQINPKVPIQNLFRMLEYAYNLKSFETYEGLSGVESINDIFENIASILSQRVLDRARKGLYQGYISEQEYLPYLRGRINIVPSMIASTRGSIRLNCEFEEFTPNLIDNQILAWTLYLIPRFQFKRKNEI